MELQNVQERNEKYFYREKFGRKYGIAVSNGSVALDVAFQMLDLNEDDEVSLKLTDWADANNISSLDAHDALADCYLMVNLARIIANNAQDAWSSSLIGSSKDGNLRSAEQILGQKDVNMNKIREIWPDIPYISKEIDDQLEINAHYRGYLSKQKADILTFKRDENLKIPENVNYDDLSGLSNEVKSKFKLIRPKTMGQALRIDGITPAAVYILLSHVKRKSIKHIA